MMEWLTNPWVIITIVVAVVVGNIAALKYTAKMKFEPGRREKDLDRLNALDKQLDAYRDKDCDKEKHDK